ncbi:MAG: hypothetical protein CMI16_12695 [Opitutaceae bacterium]|nr:hypothetical protein [Opitutaceae bacterium]
MSDSEEECTPDVALLPADRSLCVAATVYWDAALKRKVKAFRSDNGCVGGFMLSRVCAHDKCSTTTKTKDETHCRKHGGAGQCAIDGCTRKGNHKGLCTAHHVAANPKFGCPTPGCKKPRRQNRTDGLCGTCVLYNERAARLAAGEAAADAMAAALGLARAPADAKNAQPRTRYVHVSHKTDYKPCAVVQSGKEYRAACDHTGCVHLAKEGGFCKGHGGGVRCTGSQEPGKEAMPCTYDTSITTSSNRYDGRCVKCFCATFPNDPRAVEARKWFKAKEQEVIKALTEFFPEYAWTLDRRFAAGVLERPDALLSTRRRIVIVEIDEHSHRNETCAYERRREETFQQNKHPNATIAMIRFNPDAYECAYTGFHHPSCFKFSKVAGQVRVDPDQKQQWQQRLEVLFWRVGCYLDRSHPEYYKEVPPAPEGRVFYMEELFYDNVAATVTDADRAKMKQYYTRLGKRRAAAGKRAREEAGKADSDSQ